MKISIFFVVVLLTLGCKNEKGNNQTSNDANELFKDKTIDVGYISYPPGFIVDPNTKEKSGIFNDVLVEIAERNGFKINYKEEVSWATMIEALKTNRVDIIANPVWATKEREANADFSIPVYYSPIGIYTRADDNRFDLDWRKINNQDVRIAAVDGEINNYIAADDFPEANLEPFPNNVDVAQLFLEIESNKKDVTFAEPMFAYDYMQKNPGKIKNIAVKNPIRNYPNCYMHNQGETYITEFLNEEISDLIEDGTIAEIIANYLPYKGAVILPNDSLAISIQYIT